MSFFFSFKSSISIFINLLMSDAPSAENKIIHKIIQTIAGPRSAVGNVSGYRCVSDCRSRGREFDPGPVPYFRGD